MCGIDGHLNDVVYFLQQTRAFAVLLFHQPLSVGPFRMFDKAFPVFHVWPDGLRHHRPSVILSFWPSGCVNAWMWISLHSGYEVSQLNGIDNWMKVCCPLGIAVVKSDLNLWCWTSCLMECHLLLLCPNTLHSSNPTHQSGVLTYCISPTKSEVFVWRSANDPGRRQ